ARRSHGEVAAARGKGETRTSVGLGSGRQVDLRGVAEESFGGALLYFTGSKEHNVQLRQRALERGWHLNDYGLFEGGEPGRERKGGRVLASATENEIYAGLGLAFTRPEWKSRL